MHSSAKDIVDLYTRHASAWDRGRGRQLFEKPWLDEFLQVVGRRGKLLDIGCGAGEPIAQYLVDSGYDLTGVDASAPLIDLCRSRLPAQRWVVADMRHLSLDERFNGIVAWDSFFHLDAADQRAMFAVFAAHAGPGAPLLFTTGPAAGEAIGTFEGEPLFHASLDPTEYRKLLTLAGFEVVRHVAEDPTCGGHTVWLAKFGG